MPMFPASPPPRAPPPKPLPNPPSPPPSPNPNPPPLLPVLPPVSSRRLQLHHSRQIAPRRPPARCGLRGGVMMVSCSSSSSEGSCVAPPRTESRRRCSPIAAAVVEKTVNSEVGTGSVVSKSTPALEGSTLAHRNCMRGFRVDSNNGGGDLGRKFRDIKLLSQS